MTLLIVLSCIAAYLVIGFSYGRGRTVDCYRRAKAQWSSEDSARESMRMMVAWRIAAWPWGMVFDAIRDPIRSWLDSPLDDRRARANQLREDAASWRAKRHDGTPSERQMADELARMCDQWAREVDL